MGAAESTPVVLGGHEELLDTFVGPASVPLQDAFWDRLLYFSYALPKMKPEDFDEATREACTTLALNNRQTYHFGKLLVHLMRSLEAVPDAPSELPLAAVNTVYFTRLFVKHLVEYHENREIWEHLILNLTPDEAGTAHMSPGRHDLVVPVIRSLLSFIAYRDVNTHSYLLHLEVVNLFLVMCSTQLHGSHAVVSSEAQLFIQAALAQEDLAAPFVRKLLVLFISRLPLPPRVPYYIPTLTGRQGVLRRVGNAAVAVLLLPYYTYSLLVGPTTASSLGPSPQSVRGTSASLSSATGSRTPLADNALLLLLVLTHYGRIVGPAFAPGRDTSAMARGLDSAADFAGPGPTDPAGAVAGPTAAAAAAAIDAPAGSGRPAYHPNPFKTALCTAQDVAFEPASHGGSSDRLAGAEAGAGEPLLNGASSAGSGSSSSSGGAAKGGGGTAGPPGSAVVKVPFAALYDSLGTSLGGDTATLLLYSLLHGNPAFLDYCLVRSDLDTLLVPLLEMLYNAPRRTANQIYMLLIILLILSQDASFNANVHKLILPGVPWYKERLLSRISLGSLMVIILIRTVKYNLYRLRDVYLHTNCLATLANMAPHAHSLNAYASQRLVSLFHMLARKYTKLSNASSKGGAVGGEADRGAGKEDAAAGGGVRDGQNAAHTAGTEGGDGGTRHSGTGSSGVGREGDRNGNAAEADRLIQEAELGAVDAPTELHIYTDFLRIVLEIINAILTYALPRNPEFVYALLHRQELFVPFRNHPRFYELLENIFTVIEFFNARMDDKVAEGEWSVEKVLEIVVANARSWRGEGMQMFTELRFTYEEELHPEEFFVPYVWTLVVAHSGVPWSADCITMFPVHPAAEQLEEVYDADAFDTHSELGRTPRENV